MIALSENATARFLMQENKENTAEEKDQDEAIQKWKREHKYSLHYTMDSGRLHPMEKLLKSLGQVTAVIGAQWGDEGKGKLIDLLTPHFDVLARANGGANAGHTIVVEGKKHVFHLLPAGCLHEGKTVYLGSGMVIALPTLLEEIRTLKAAGIDIIPRLFISRAAHIIFDFHKDVDGKLEDWRASITGEKLGTTKRGIGPAYMEKAARTGIRMEEFEGDWDERTLRGILEHHRDTASRMYGIDIKVEEELTQLKEAHALLHKRITPMTSLLTLLKKQKRILIEGAQATLLDLDHGTYPFVTSSSTTSAGALQGLGLPPQCLSSCIGVVKAYCTRVGSGPFPTEAENETGDRLRERGAEYGATTGRPRRCGWLSLPDLKFAAALNGFTHLNLTKLDVLDKEKEIPVFFDEGFRNLPGWNTETKGITTFEKLAKEAQDYVKVIEKEARVPVSFIGTGPGREEMIIR